jgi:hypothetical protein
MRYFWNVEEGVGATCALSEIMQLYAAPPHLLRSRDVISRPLIGPGVRLCPHLLTMSYRSFSRIRR